MTDLEQSDGIEDARSQLDAITELDIAQLRKAAKLMNIPSQRDWSKEDFVTAIKQKQQSNALAQFVFDNSQAPAPGYARVIIHRDQTPGHKNTPLHLGVNGRLIQIPRGGEYDIPIPFVEVLKNAKTVVMGETANAPGASGGVLYRDEEQTSYPFQVISVTPGKFENSHDGRAGNYAKRYAFFQKYGHWATEGELKEYNKIQMTKD